MRRPKVFHLDPISATREDSPGLVKRGATSPRPDRDGVIEDVHAAGSDGSPEHAPTTLDIEDTEHDRGVIRACPRELTEVPRPKLAQFGNTALPGRGIGRRHELRHGINACAPAAECLSQGNRRRPFAAAEIEHAGPGPYAGVSEHSNDPRRGTPKRIDTLEQQAQEGDQSRGCTNRCRGFAEKVVHGLRLARSRPASSAGIPAWDHSRAKNPPWQS